MSPLEKRNFSHLVTNMFYPREDGAALHVYSSLLLHQIGGWRLVHGIQFSNFLAQREAVKVVTHLVVYCVMFQERAAIMTLGS